MMRSLLRVVVVALVLAGSTAPALAEGIIDLYVGSAMTRASDVKVSTPAFSESERIDWDTSITAGGRLGVWFESLDWLGLALDVSYFKPDKDVKVFPISALLMLRLPLLRDESVPHGRLQPYVAAGPGLFVTWVDGDVGNLGINESAASVDVGVDVRGGLALMLTKHIGIFGEYRFTHVKPDFGLDIVDVNFKVKTTFDTHHVVGGVTFRF